MGFEIYEERLVARDGKVQPQQVEYHNALVYGERGTLEVRVATGGAEESLCLKVREPSEDDDVTVNHADFNAAVAALRRLRGADAPTPDAEELRERSAVAVERAAELLEEKGGDVGHTLAGQLRATMLQLIDLATSRGETTPKLESASS
jgi:hypothetical protein